MGTFPQDFPTDTIAAGGGGGAVDYRASGAVAIPNGAQSVAVVFSTAMNSINYALNVTFQNSVDGVPIMLQGVITARTVNGFTFTFNAPTDSGNYKLHYEAWGNS